MVGSTMISLLVACLACSAFATKSDSLEYPGGGGKYPDGGGYYPGGGGDWGDYPSGGGYYPSGGGDYPGGGGRPDKGGDGELVVET
ncbi:MAG: hypothetical protein WDW38_010902 [Sanguina aurantia]